jgi:hypothetical protein
MYNIRILPLLKNKNALYSRIISITRIIIAKPQITQGVFITQSLANQQNITVSMQKGLSFNG